MAVSNINPSVYSVSSTTVQALASVALTTPITGTNDTGVPYYVKGARSQAVQFNTIVANVGNAITALANTSGSGFTLAGGNITYELTGFAALTTGSVVDPHSNPTIQWFNTDSNTAIGAATPVGTPVTTIYSTTANVANVALRVTQGGTVAAWEYPSQVISAQATIEEISGFQGS